MKHRRLASSFLIFYAKRMPLTPFTLPSFAKINWFLRIHGKRNDGFHQLSTIFQTVSLHDNLTFREADEITLTCDDETIPTDEQNLIIRAAQNLRERYEIENGAQIHLEKRIPSPGGLGGGSSNAAVTLIGLSRLWKLKFNFEELLEIGTAIGSDVPFFLYGGTALGIGRGTEISILDDWKEDNILIVTPNIAVSTAAAFARLNLPDLTNFDSKSILQICRDEAQTLQLKLNELVNDFEETIFEKEFEIRCAKEKLLGYGSHSALMSGSGASVFGVFDSEEILKTAFDKIKSEQNWRVFNVKTISRREYQTILEIK